MICACCTGTCSSRRCGPRPRSRSSASSASHACRRCSSSIRSSVTRTRWSGHSTRRCACPRPRRAVARTTRLEAAAAADRVRAGRRAAACGRARATDGPGHRARRERQDGGADRARARAGAPRRARGADPGTTFNRARAVELEERLAAAGVRSVAGAHVPQPRLRAPARGAPRPPRRAHAAVA